MEKKKNNLKKFRFKFIKLTPRVITACLIGLTVFISLWFLSLPNLFTYRNEVGEGSIAQKDIYSTADFWVVDKEETKAVIDKKIAEFYRPVCSYNIQVKEKTLRELFDFIEKEELPAETKGKMKSFLNEEYPEYILAGDFRKALIRANKGSILITEGEDKTREELSVKRITDADELEQMIVPHLHKGLRLDSSEVDFIVKKFTPTLEYNPEESEKFRNELADSVLPKERFIARGQNIVRKGDKITAGQLLDLDALDKFVTRVNLKKRILGSGLLMLVTVALIIAYLYRLPYKPQLLNQHLGVIGIVAVGLLFLVKYSLNWFPLVFIPVASGAMLIALLLSTPLAVAFAFLVSLLASSLAGGRFDLLIIFLLGSLAGILAVRHIRQRLDLFKAAIPLGLVNMATILSFGLIQTLGFPEIGKHIIWGWGNSLLCVVIVTGVSPIFESFFKVTSDINLLELSDLNRPILRRLMIEASGTYHHSLIVGNLAEAAAEKIKANSLLARVGSYYHDIGKLYKPEYFNENQARAKSRHEKLIPRMSSLVIAAHVKEGTALARESKLPQILIDFIEQHHGTTLMWIFYQAALEKKNASEIKEEDFRYPGPKPQTREVAIVMLADAVEAASRTLDEPTPSRLRNLVNQIINDKFLDAQLEECNLSLRNLHEIGESFIYTLTGLFHVRVEYPQSGKKNNDRRTKKKNRANSVSLGEKNRPGNSKEIAT